MRFYLLLIIILPLFSINVLAFYWGESTYTCNKEAQQINIDQPIEECIEGQKAYWTFIIGTTAEDSVQDQIRGVWIVDSNGNTIAINRSVRAIRLQKNLEPFVYTTLEGVLPAPTRGNTLMYTFCFEYNSYDEFAEDYVWTDSCSQDTVSLFMKSLSDIECQTSKDCEYNQYCEDMECKLINCNSCEYIENQECKPYNCCEDSQCTVEERCINHNCIRIECEEGEYLENHSCKPLNCEGNQTIVDHKCIDLQCGSFQKAINHECKTNTKLIVSVISILGLIIVSAILYFIKFGKVSKISKKRK